MNSFIRSMDQHTTQDIGEKGHLQNTWSNDTRKKIAQLYFQLVRCKDHRDLESQWNLILSSFVNKEKIRINDLCLVIKLVAHVRDIQCGKGEQKLSFMLLYNLHHYYPEIAMNIFRRFIDLGPDIHPYGSMKDIKYFCQYIFEKSGDQNHPFIKDILTLAKHYLNMDDNKFYYYYTRVDTEKPRLTLIGKWLPRDGGGKKKKKKFAWINKELAKIYYPGIMASAKSERSKKAATKKCQMQLRKLLSALNKYLDTTQIKMCKKTWSEIEFAKVTGPTLRKNRKAFQNKTKKGEKRSDDYDRVKCAQNLQNHLEESKKNQATTHGKRCNVYELVKDALAATTQTDIDLVNEQWKDNMTNNASLKDQYVIPMSDVSSSMECDEKLPMYNSIGLGIRTSELTHPSFRDRVLTFHDSPTCVKFNPEMTFYQKVLTLNRATWGGCTNFYKALQMILDVCVKDNVPPTDVEKMVLAIFSDMQIDLADRSCNFTTMMENIKILFSEAGLTTTWRKPYPVPHILFWNLRKTNGFPTTVYEPNCSMISGYSSALLNIFSEKGIQEMKNLTPFLILSSILKGDRYNNIEILVHDYFR